MCLAVLIHFRQIIGVGSSVERIYQVGQFVFFKAIQRQQAFGKKILSAMNVPVPHAIA